MNYYLLFKALHIISVISWMAGLLYLPRLYVYHAETVSNEEKIETFKVMEKRLFFYIMNPAMVASWLFGVLLIYTIGLENFQYLWLQLKLIMVLLLTFYHFFLFKCLKDFSTNSNQHTPKFYRILNEVPTVLLIAIVFIVIFKPV